MSPLRISSLHVLVCAVLFFTFHFCNGTLFIKSLSNTSNSGVSSHSLQVLYTALDQRAYVVTVVYFITIISWPMCAETIAYQHSDRSVDLSSLLTPL